MAIKVIGSDELMSDSSRSRNGSELTDELAAS
jgi:hypothetical protein